MRRIRAWARNAPVRLAARQSRTERWSTYVGILAAGSLLFFLGMVALIAVVDPWKALPASASIDRPVTSINQRLYYPMLLRTRQFDSYVFGSSTGMLVDPQRLNEELGGRFINLALTDGRAWEQLEMLSFVLTRNRQPRALMFAIDWVWCVGDLAREDRETRRFPLWIYREPAWANIWRMLNAEAFYDTLRTLRFAIGRYRPFIRDDGYWLFAPSQYRYDPEAALQLIYGSGPRAIDPPIVPPEAVPDEVKKAWAFPLLDRMAEMLDRVPAATQVLFVAMPVHAMAQPRPGSAHAQREAACKQRIAGIAAKRGSVLIDFRIRSEVTQTDSNYWDSLHYRIFVARQIEQSVGAAIRSQQSDPAGFWRVIDAR